MKNLLMSMVVLCGSLNTAIAHDPKTPYAIDNYSLDRLTKRIYVVHGGQEMIGPSNRGFMNNPGAILTDAGVIIVDPGSSAEVGEKLLRKVRAVSDKPVIAVFNTHVHGDHWLGNHGIRKSFPRVPIYAHKRMIERLEAGEGEEYLKLVTTMTKGAIAETRVIAPNIGLEGGEVLSLDGVKLKIHHIGHAHTDHDLMIEVVDDKGLFFGDVVADRRVPNSDVPRDANFKGSINTIKTILGNERIKVFIPGHGTSGGREVPKAFLRFLETLYASVNRYYDQDLTDYEMKDKVVADLDEFKDWNNFEEIGRVISFVYQEVERTDFVGAAGSRPEL